jgi:antitoxin ParD1/3/4
MESMNISLPERLRDFVLQQVEAGYSSASEYIRELIRADEAKKQQEALEAKLLEGLSSGPGRELTEEDWEALKQTLVSRHKAARKSST